MVGDVCVDGPIHSIDGGPSSTLLSEAKKLAAAAGSDKCVISFVGITCPFARAYALKDLWNAKGSSGVPTLHVYIREAEPCDVFDAGGMHITSPLAMRRMVPWHQSLEERALVAQETRKFFEEWEGKGAVNMWMDSMDDRLEAAFEARPWRQYVIRVFWDGNLAQVHAKLGLAPFNMDGKCQVIKDALA